VIRNLYYFYQGTYALEVKHAGGFIVRYGEITGKKAKEISEGGKVKQGQIVGYMGKVNSKCCEPMLHFELYTGKKTGSLSQRGKGNKYHRRSDLVDPTKYLLRWEQESLK
jgi:murein DD-endopeptidase MepM/ murein hydrolase activator NlpD